LLFTVTVYVPDMRPVAVAAVPPPPLQLYVGLTGLVIVTVAVPLLRPQVVAVELVVSDTPVDAVTETLAVAEHPLLVAVTEYVPDGRPVMLAVVPWPPLHIYVGLTGLVIVAVAVPLLRPQVVAVDDDDNDIDVVGTVAVAVAEHAPEVTVTVYIPPTRPASVAKVVDPPAFHA
jgi:hypothetical protein